MHQLVQSAIEAAKLGDKNKAIDFLKQVLNANPNDIDAWLVLAAVMDDPQRKRQCLNRVLTLDPVNMMARDELVEMDRAAMGGGTPPFTPQPSHAFASRASGDQSPGRPAPVSKPAPQPEKPYYSSGTYSFEPVPDDQEQVVSTPPIAKTQIALQPKPSSKARAEKPLVFKFPLFWRILMFLAVAFFGCFGLLIAVTNVINSLPFLGLALLTGIVMMAFSPKVEITEADIRGSGMFTGTEARWGEIVSMRSNAWKRRLELIKGNGEVVPVSTQVTDYPRVVEIIRQKRPDLFGGAAQPGMSGSQGGTTLHAFAGTKTFKRGFFAQYGIFLLMFPLCLFGVWILFASEDKFVGLGVGFIGLFFMGMSLFSINQVKLDPNKLTTETLFGEKEYTAREIGEISIKTVRSRQGIANNFIHIRPVKGSAISLAGFPEGDEIIYGILVNWWETYKSR